MQKQRQRQKHRQRQRQEAGLTAECSRGTETTPAQETGMTAPDVEGCSTKLLLDFLGHVAGHTASALLRGLAALARAPPPGGGGEAMAKPGADSAWNARLRVLARALALPAYAALFRPRSRLVPPITPCFGRALRPSERVSSRGGHFQARLDWRISRGGAGGFPEEAQAQGGRQQPGGA